MKQLFSKVSSHMTVISLLGAFTIYVGLELAFNLLLIEIYSKPLELLFGEYKLATERLELFGRTLSSFGIALVLTPMILKIFFEKPVSESQSLNPVNTTKKWTGKICVFFLTWLALIPLQRVLVDGWVHATSNESKLSAVRAIVYKEGYLADRIAIESFDEFNVIAQDPERRDLVVALIPSLAYFSKSFNGLIKQNTESIADIYLTNEQKSRFERDGLPRLRQFDARFKAEYDKYREANNNYQTALAKLDDKQGIVAEANSLLEGLNKHINNQWDLYVTFYESAYDSFDYLAKEKWVQEAHHKFKDQYESKKCNSACIEQVTQAHADYLNKLEYQNGRLLGIFVKPSDIIWGTFGTKERLEIMFRDGRRNWLRGAYRVGDAETLEQFAASDNARKVAISYFKDKEVILPENWQLSDIKAIENEITKKYQRIADSVWKTYASDSAFGTTEPGLGRVAFATHRSVLRHARESLGQYYISDFSLGLPEKIYIEKWLAQQNNISFIRMVTSTAATAAFSPGGVLYNVGNDAVKLSVIPPFSIGLSFLAIFVLFIKLVLHFGRERIGPASIVMIAGGLLIVFPTVKSIYSEHSYHAIMSQFAQDFNKDDDLEKLKTHVFGAVLDLENALFSNYREMDYIGDVAKAFGIRSGKRASETHDLVLAIRSYDDSIYQMLDWLPEKFNTGEVVEPFDANVTLLKRDHSIGAFLGLYFQGEKVKGVRMPNFLADSDMGLLLDQKLFYSADYGSAVKSFIDNYNDPSYLLGISDGSVLKTSAISKLEKLMTSYLNKNKTFAGSLKVLKDSGHANLVLWQPSIGANYRCFTLPSITSDKLSEALIRNNVGFKELPNCQGFL
tara:strand:+ start:7347 stop:9890 length:2544 start_codon:yes stop_codon:yes gene_type:complete